MGMQQAARQGRWTNRPKFGDSLIDGELIPNADVDIECRLADRWCRRGCLSSPDSEHLCRRGDLNPHAPRRALGPQPSASTKFRHSDVGR